MELLVEDQSAEEGAQNALDAAELRHSRSKEDHGEYENVLHDVVGLVAEEPADDAWEDGEDHHHVEHESHAEPHPLEDVVDASECAGDDGEHHQGEDQGEHGGGDTDDDAGTVHQSVSADDGVGDERV